MEEKLFFNASDYEIQYEEKDNETSDTIYIVKNINNNTNYRATIINAKNNFDGNEQMTFLHESLILHQLNHPAISHFIGINFKSLTNTNIFKPTFITEYFPNGSIKNIIGNQSRNILSNNKLTSTKKIINLLGISDAIQYLHEQGITHLNLQSKNILLDSNYYPRISHFYFTKFLRENIDLTKEIKNDSLIYLAPEILLNKENSDQSVDVYSFAMIAYEIITEKVPFSEVDSIDLRNKILKGYRPTFPEFVSLNIQNLFSRCWDENPEKRPSFKEIFYFLSFEVQLKDDVSIDKEEIKNYLSILNECHSNHSNDKNKCNFDLFNDLKATVYTCFGDFYQSNDNIKNISKKIEYFEKAAKLDSSYALYTLGTFSYNGDGVEQNFIKAKDYFEKSVKYGNSEAMVYLGIMYYNGEGVEQNFIKSKDYFEEALKYGNSEAMIYLGIMYYNGEGVEQSFTKSKDHFEEALKYGNSEAMNYLGIMYYYGEGAEQNFTKAKDYFEEALKHGNSEAMNYLGIMYYYGEGVEQDISKSKFFFEKAADLGNLDAYESLNNINHPKNDDPYNCIGEIFAFFIILILMTFFIYIFRYCGWTRFYFWTNLCQNLLFKLKSFFNIFIK